MVRQGSAPTLKPHRLERNDVPASELGRDAEVACDKCESLELVLAQLSEALADLDLLGLTLAAAQLSHVIDTVQAELWGLRAERHAAT